MTSSGAARSARDEPRLTGSAECSVLEPKRWAEWDAFLKGLSESRLRQTSVYAAGLQLYGWTPRVVALQSATGTILAGALVGEKPLPLIGGSRLQVSGGIAVRPDLRDEEVDAFFVALKSYARERRAVWVHMEWRRPYSIGENLAPGGEADRARLVRHGITTLEPTGTYYFATRGHTRDSLEGALGRQARQNIRHARRDGVEVVAETSPEALAAFRAAHEGMTSRKGLAGWPERFARDVLGPAIAAGHGRLLTAMHRGRRINMIFVGTVGAPLYEWGAIAAHEAGIPPTGELLHHEAMCLALDGPHGFYDLGGSPGPEPVPDHPNYSVWRFKKKLGGVFVWFAGEGDLVLRPAAARILRAARRFRPAR